MEIAHLIQVDKASPQNEWKDQRFEDNAHLCEQHSALARDGVHLEFHDAVSHSNFAASIRIPRKVLGGALAAASRVAQHSQGFGMWGLRRVLLYPTIAQD